MAETKNKIYVAKNEHLSFAWQDEKGRRDTVYFTNGEFATSDPEIQAHIEASEHFVKGAVSLKPSPLEALKAKAADLRAKAKAAGDEAAKAEAEVKVAEKSPVAA